MHALKSLNIVLRMVYKHVNIYFFQTKLVRKQLQICKDVFNFRFTSIGGILGQRDAKQFHKIYAILNSWYIRTYHKQLSLFFLLNLSEAILNYFSSKLRCVNFVKWQSISRNGVQFVCFWCKKHGSIIKALIALEEQHRTECYLHMT